MFQSQCLTEQQKGVLEDLFFSTLTVQEVMEKWKASRYEYCKWHLEESFAREFNRMLELLRLESKLVLARYSSQIAVKMVSLAMEEDSEIARQACMDVINHPDFNAAQPAANPSAVSLPALSLPNGPNPAAEEPQVSPLPPELASKWLSELANYRGILTAEHAENAEQKYKINSADSAVSAVKKAF